MKRFHAALMIGAAFCLSGCGKSEQERKIEETAKNNAEFNLRNVVGIMEYCAGRGYLDRKLIEKQKENYADDLDAETEKMAEAAYMQGRKGNLLLRMNLKPGESGAGSDGAEPAKAKIDVAFTRTEQQNGELSVFCKRTELWAAREAAAAKQARGNAQKQEGDGERKFGEEGRAASKLAGQATDFLLRDSGQ